MATVVDLLKDALSYPDYDKRINFLVAGLLSADANDTPEKEAINKGYLKDVYEYCCHYKGEQKKYINQIKDIINNYVN